MTQVPTKEEIGKELDKTLAENPNLKQCVNCHHYNPGTSECAVTYLKMYPFINGCNGKHFLAQRDYLIEKAHAELVRQARECEKIEFLLAMALTAANTTMLFITDFERRVKNFYKQEKEKAQKGKLKKDLDLADQLGNATKKIQQHLDKIESQYRFYFQSHLDKIFKKEGVYNEQGYDQHQSDGGMFGITLLKMARAGHHNEKNVDSIFAYMDSLANDQSPENDESFCMEDSDFKFYQINH